MKSCEAHRSSPSSVSLRCRQSFDGSQIRFRCGWRPSGFWLFHLSPTEPLLLCGLNEPGLLFIQTSDQCCVITAGHSSLPGNAFTILLLLPLKNGCCWETAPPPQEMTEDILPQRSLAEVKVIRALVKGELLFNYDVIQCLSAVGFEQPIRWR